MLVFLTRVPEIYASTAALSRATSAQNHPHANKSAEVMLTKIFVHDSLQRINHALNQLEWLVFTF